MITDALGSGLFQLVPQVMRTPEGDVPVPINAGTLHVTPLLTPPFPLLLALHLLTSLLLGEVKDDDSSD